MLHAYCLGFTNNYILCTNININDMYTVKNNAVGVICSLGYGRGYSPKQIFYKGKIL